MPDSGHQLLEKVDIMIAYQPACQYFTGIEEVSQIRPCEVATGIARAVFIEGRAVPGIHARLDNDLPFRCERHPGSSVPGREYTIEQVYAEAHCLQYILGIAAAHKIPDLAGWEYPVHLLDHFRGDLGRFADHEAADTVPVKREVNEPLAAFFSQAFIGSTLDYAE